MKIFSFDAETNGLYGEAFSIGAIVMENGQETSTFVARCPIEGEVNPYVAENVLPQMEQISETHENYDAMLESFMQYYMDNKEDADVIVHMGVPVEAKLFLDAHKKGIINDYDGPYPLIDISAYPEVGTSVDTYNRNNNIVVPDIEGGTHNPIYDSRAAALSYQSVMQKIQQTQTLSENINNQENKTDVLISPTGTFTQFRAARMFVISRGNSFGEHVVGVSHLKENEVSEIVEALQERENTEVANMAKKFGHPGGKSFFYKREVPVINDINDITKEEDLMINNDILNISDLADACSKAPIKRTLPNGKEIEQITWEGSDMKTINQLLHEKDKPEHVKIDGAAPAWLVAGICHELHPSSCSVNTPQGYMPVGCKPPNGAGSGENLQFQSKQSGDWTVIEVSQKDSSIPLDLNKLSDMEPPEIEMGSKVILSGRMPNVAMCSMANAYQHKAKAIGFYQPNVGATVSITHDPEIELGSVVPDELIKQEERRTKLNNLVNPTQNPISKV